ncbi:type II toxin-antitoxin system RelE/ParE family toxin [Pseudactinotalea sp. HY160]|uniref:type II toxin-antitoxin system RelE family toxin n=1 Tax=Pseudactinotalea sp. HY160 TaxID=2654490 RepID=UPI00351BBE47
MASTARRQIRELPRDGQERVIAVLTLLVDEPRPPASKKLTGRDARRVRTGSWRLIYEIHDDELLVIVVAAGNRMLNGPEDLLAVRVHLGRLLVDSASLSGSARTGLADRGPRRDSATMVGTVSGYDSSEWGGSRYVYQRKRGAQDPVPSH